MANHAHSTRTPLLRLSGSPQPLLGLGLGRQPSPVTRNDNLSDAEVSANKKQPGPVTIALAAMQAADPDRQRIRELRRRIADRIEADIALLDALDGDTDLEADYADVRPARDGTLYTLGCTSDDEPSLCGLMVQSPGGLGDDREHDEDEGLDPIPDWSGRGVHEVFVGRRA
jgi:hypothetical protein